MKYSFSKNEIKQNKNGDSKNYNDKKFSTSDDESNFNKIASSKFSSKVSDAKDDFFIENEK